MTPPLDDARRDKMIAYIAEEWVDGIDIKDLLRQQLIEYTEELDSYDDDRLLEEYKAMTE